MSDVDVLVAGAGAAGLAAALAAAEAGSEVALIDASQTYPAGSNTAMSTSMIPAAGSRWQQSAGIDDSPERFRDDIRRKTAGHADRTVTRALTDVAPELVAWLHDHCGVTLELVTDFDYPGHSRRRCHAVPDRSGRTLHTRLRSCVARTDAIAFSSPMRLEQVVSHGDRVTGAVLTTPDGRRDEVAAGHIVLAIGGFGADPTLVRTHLPEIADGLYHGGDGNQGDALRVGEQVSADVAGLDAYQGHGSVATPHGVLLTWATVMHGAVLLNSAGERFGDETTGYSEFGANVIAQPGRIAWMVFDRRIHDACLPFADFRDLIGCGAVRWADGVDELATVIGAPREPLARSLAAAHDASEGRSPDRYGRTRWEAPLRPPYAAVKVTGALFHTQGGLAVDPNARVLRRGVPVPGLYAAGGAAVGMSGRGADGYLAGNGLLAALGLGYLAGRHAGRRPASSPI
ncbi:MAG: FAD-binding protein [Streptosporangiales bacterium]|nr:FAD-binding protein [Streptosporangiales bacterium]